MAELPDPFDRTAYPRLVHREWVLMHQRGVRIEQIARLNHRTPAEVLQYLKGVYGRAPELFPDRPRRELVYDRPRPRPDTWPDRDRPFTAKLAELEAFLVEHGRHPYHGGYSTTEGRLAHWLNVQRSNHTHGTLPGHRARWLTEALPDWGTDTRTLHHHTHWQHMLEQLVAHRTAHGTLPTRTEDPAHGKLTTWLYNQRSRHRRGDLNPARRQVRDSHQATLDAAYAAHPECFSRHPRAPKLPTRATINDPLMRAETSQPQQA